MLMCAARAGKVLEAENGDTRQERRIEKQERARRARPFVRLVRVAVSCFWISGQERAGLIVGPDGKRAAAASNV